MNNYRKWVRQREAFMGYVRKKSDYISNARRLEALHKETYLFLSERKELERLEQYPFADVAAELVRFENSSLYNDENFFKKLEWLRLHPSIVDQIFTPIPVPPA